VLLLDRLEDFRVRDRHFLRLAALFAQHQTNAFTLLQHARTAQELAKPDLGTLQVAEDADRPLDLLRQGAQISDHLAQHVVPGVAHIDTENVHTRLE
jgi:hypothetical protein